MLEDLCCGQTQPGIFDARADSGHIWSPQAAAKLEPKNDMAADLDAKLL
jgi:hypothetical protein